MAISALTDDFNGLLTDQRTMTTKECSTTTTDCNDQTAESNYYYHTYHTQLYENEALS
jgi:hypothetical protein